MAPRILNARAAALIGAGALALHELRYAVGYREHAQETLAGHGHGYLAVLAPIAAALVVMALCGALRRAAAASRPAGEKPSLARLWIACTLSLVAIHLGQEWLESELVAGHPDAVSGLVGHHGWVAALLAVALGALVAIALRGATAARELAPTVGRIATWTAGTNHLHPRTGQLGAPEWLGRCLAARGPPTAFA